MAKLTHVSYFKKINYIYSTYCCFDALPWSKQLYCTWHGFSHWVTSLAPSKCTFWESWATFELFLADDVMPLCSICLFYVLADSVCQESMRISSGVFMIRKVLEDTDFTTADGRSHLIRKGDRVAMYPPAIHYDSEIFPEPEVCSTTGKSLTPHRSITKKTCPPVKHGHAYGRATLKLMSVYGY